MSERISAKYFCFFVVWLLVAGCKQGSDTTRFETRTATEDGYTYEYVTNDPLNTRIYTLENGLKVYLSPYAVAPRIMTLIAVRAGGKYDPAHSTGLAHYLEHMMFKGTTQIGTLDWEKEKVMLDSLENLFEQYRLLTDEKARKAHYAKIDVLSSEAARLAIANEYDKILSTMGASGTNAYTSYDRTVYINDIPSNELERWLKTESDRFSFFAPRLFHTELETVYEEKNMSIDEDGYRAYEALMEALFPGHPYGTQTILGSVEHLKNPSIRDIKAYFDQFYVPNNMAICMSGDLDPAKTIRMIDQYFGKLPSKPLEPVRLNPAKPLDGPITREVIGPDAENVMIGFRMPERAHPDAELLNLVDYLLSNSEAGLLDINLKQKQLVLDPGAYVGFMNDHSYHFFYGTPREGQTLEEVRDLLLAQIDSLKQGRFEDWLPKAVVTNFEVSQIRRNESTYARANAFVEAFDAQISWADYISSMERLKKVTREDILNFANKYYQDQYVVVFKREGENPGAPQVEKPAITPVPVNRDAQSVFFTSLMAEQPPRLQPVFLDFSKDLSEGKTPSGVPVIYKQNQENSLFTLYYLLDVGSNSNPTLQVAVDYLQYIGTDKLSAEAFKKELYKLGSKFGIFANEDRMYVYLNGPDAQMGAAVALFESLLANPREDQEALDKMVEGKLKKRQDMQKDKFAILFDGLMNYGKFGSSSPYANQLSNKELKALKAADLTEMIKKITRMEHRVLYYGPKKMDELIGFLEKNHPVPSPLEPLPREKQFVPATHTDNVVYWTHYPMVQAEIMAVAKSQDFKVDAMPAASVFNEYYGGNMSSVLFQELREAKGLAYSVWGGYSMANKPGKPNFINAYIGTQSDKIEEALDGLMGLMEEMLESEQAFSNARDAILNRIESERVVKTSVLFSYEDAKMKQVDQDLRKMVYEAVKTMDFEELKAFHAEMIKGRKYAITVLGDRGKLNFKTLAKYGKVQEVTMQELFPFIEGIPLQVQ